MQDLWAESIAPVDRGVEGSGFPAFSIFSTWELPPSPKGTTRHPGELAQEQPTWETPLPTGGGRITSLLGGGIFGGGIFGGGIFIDKLHHLRSQLCECGVVGEFGWNPVLSDNLQQRLEDDFEVHPNVASFDVM